MSRAMGRAGGRENKMQPKKTALTRDKKGEELHNNSALRDSPHFFLSS